MKAVRAPLLAWVFASAAACAESGSGEARDAQGDRAEPVIDAAPIGNADARDGTQDALGLQDVRDAADANEVADAPAAWPPPGVLYLTKMTSVDEYDRLHQNRREVPFFIRRRGNDDVYPYPWNEHECIFHVPISHLSFLRQIDPDRAIQLYFVDAKSKDGNLLPGRFITEPTATEVTVLFENTVGLMATPVFPLDPATAAQLRARFMRCVPFGTSFKFLMVCEDGETCPLP